MSIVPDLIENGSNCDIGAVRVVAVGITNGADLVPVIATGSELGFQRSLSDQLRDESGSGDDSGVVVFEESI